MPMHELKEHVFLDADGKVTKDEDKAVRHLPVGRITEQEARDRGLLGEPAEKPAKASKTTKKA